MTEPTTAPDPELVAVFDLTGTVDNFISAASRVDGLEFLADLQEDFAEPDDDFYFEQDGEVTDAGVPETLYMVMTNAQAVTELIRLFELWQRDRKITFDRGLNPLKEVFGLLRAIRRWGPQDRVRETGLLEQWREDVEVVGNQGFARVEIELWYRAESTVRATAQAQVAQVVGASGGRVITTSDQPAIAYHGVLADIPMAQVEQVLAHGPGAIDLLTTERIMMVSPNRPMAFPMTEPFPDGELTIDTPRPTGKPRIALLDGVPMANHVALEGRLFIDDPDERRSRYTTAQRSHGTAMASLIAHGDLSKPGPAIQQPLYIRPVLQPHEYLDGEEVVPPDELLVDLVHRAIRRMFERDGSQDPAAPSVRLVNLSIGDPARTFVRRLSPLARLLDWLAHTYNLVIVVSGGNHNTMPTVTADAGVDTGPSAAELMRSLHTHAATRRLLSPAEAINVVTVGALHDDAANVQLPDTVLDLLPRGVPASYSSYGFGFRRAVKPDVLLPGGRQVFQSPPPGNAATIELTAARVASTGPGLRVAAPGHVGERNGVSFSCGTSNAAALATRSINMIFDVLETLQHEDGEFPFPDPQYHPVLAKTLLVHAAGWHELSDTMRRLLHVDGRDTRRELTKLMGYGPVREDRMATADSTRAVLLGAGSITKDQRHTFRYPLPSALSATTEWRRLTITLGWLSPVNVRSQKYRMARLQFALPRDSLGVTPKEADHNAVFKGTVQHQVLEGSAAVAYVDGSDLAIDIDCRIDAGTLRDPVRYGLVASLEVSAAVQVDLHEQVRARLREDVRTRARTQIGEG